MGGIGRSDLKMQRVAQIALGIAHLNLQNSLQFNGCKNSEFPGSAHQVETVQQANQSEIMIAVQVGDKHGFDFTGTNPEVSQPHLGAFAAIQQKKSVTCL